MRGLRRRGLATIRAVDAKDKGGQGGIEDEVEDSGEGGGVDGAPFPPLANTVHTKSVNANSIVVGAAAQEFF